MFSSGYLRTVSAITVLVAAWAWYTHGSPYSRDYALAAAVLGLYALHVLSIRHVLSNQERQERSLRAQLDLLHRLTDPSDANLDVDFRELSSRSARVPLPAERPGDPAEPAGEDTGAGTPEDAGLVGIPATAGDAAGDVPGERQDEAPRVAVAGASGVVPPERPEPRETTPVLRFVRESNGDSPRPTLTKGGTRRTWPSDPATQTSPRASPPTSPPSLPPEAARAADVEARGGASAPDVPIPRHFALGTVALIRRLLTPSQVAKVLMEQRRQPEKRFASLAVELGFLTDSQREELLLAQQEGLFTEAEMREARERLREFRESAARAFSEMD